MTYTIDEARVAALVLDEADRLGHWRPKTGTALDLFLFGVRAPSVAAGRWDDVLGAIWWEEERWHCRLWPGTTDPGRDGASVDDAKLHRGGTAILVPGQVRGMWQIGVHRRGTPSAHEALVQVVPAPFWRDANADGQLDDVGPVSHDVIGCNAHRAWRDGLSTVGYASLACQVWKWASHHTEAMSLARRQLAAHPA